MNINSKTFMCSTVVDVCKRASMCAYTYTNILILWVYYMYFADSWFSTTEAMEIEALKYHRLQLFLKSSRDIDYTH